jgi:hypothetical protein
MTVSLWKSKVLVDLIPIVLRCEAAKGFLAGGVPNQSVNFRLPELDLPDAETGHDRVIKRLL